MIITIDPGASGAVAIIKDGHVVTHSFKDESGTIEFIKFHANDPNKLTRNFAYLEQVSSMPGQGVTSMFSFGANFGFYRGVLQALDIPFDMVRPQKWQKDLSIPVTLKGKDNQSARKKWMKQKAAELFPYIKVTLSNADALLMLHVYRSR